VRQGSGLVNGGQGTSRHADSASSPDLAQARAALASAEGVVILTGAGVSAESGVPTFRDPTEGLWSRYRPEDLATPQAFQRDPRLVWEWYDHRRRAIMGCRPNPGHRAIARFLLERTDAVLVTQNVDGLHHRALELELEARESEARTGKETDRSADRAANRILPLHGDLMVVRCRSCSYRRTDRSPVDTSSVDSLPHCPECDELLRPAVVWFGEMLPEEALTRSFEAARGADICIVAGTSAVVHPAASVPTATLAGGGGLIEVNPAETPLTRRARWRFPRRSGELLPRLLEGR